MTLIYDCFIFFNELDLLELRLKELNQVVDKFVLIEADRTFQNGPKPYYFEENKERFEKYLPKIIHIKLDKYPKFNKLFNPFSPWKLETFQRNAMTRGLKNCRPEDLVLFSDVDEIPNPEVLQEIKEQPLNQILGLKMHMYMYFFNNKVIFSKGSKMTEEESKNGLWHCTAVVPYKLLKKKPQHYRRTIMRTKRKGEVYKIIPNAGWHFTYLGGVQKIKEKLEAFSHTEYNNDTYKNEKNIKESLMNGNDLFGRDLEFEIIDSQADELPTTLKEENLNQEYSQHFFSS